MRERWSFLLSVVTCKRGYIGDGRLSHLIFVRECEELREVEDDGHQEERERVAQPCLGAQTELKAVNGLLDTRNQEQILLVIASPVWC
jgi:hypothetical protein